MVDATISCVRIRDLPRPGRFRPGFEPGRASQAWLARRACASRRESGAEASTSAAALPSRPRAGSSRPGVDDLVASTI